MEVIHESAMDDQIEDLEKRIKSLEKTVGHLVYFIVYDETINMDQKTKDAILQSFED